MAAQELLQHYLNQARACEQSGQLRQRDRFLVLALDIAWQAGKVSDAEQIWQRLRAVNPHHVLVGFASLQQALENPVIQQYLVHARTTPPSLSETKPPGETNASHSSPVAKNIGTTAGELLLPLQTSLMHDANSTAATSSQGTCSVSAGTFREREAIPSGTDARQRANPIRNATASFTLHSGPKLRDTPLGNAEQHIASGEQVGKIRGSESDLARTDCLSSWVAGSLAVLVFVVGVAVLAYVLFAPFLLSGAN
jgi:hypothetical protein